MQASSFISVLAAGSGLCLGAVPLAVPSRNRGGWMQCVPAGVRVTPWAPGAETRLAQKGEWENGVSTVNAWFDSHELFRFQIPVSAFMV